MGCTAEQTVETGTMIETSTTPATGPASTEGGPAVSSAEAASSSVELDFDRHPLVLFDGVCGLCNHAVDFILRHDPAGVFRFAPLQGETAARLAADDPQLASDLQSLSTLIVVDARGTHRRSSAVVAILKRLGLPWRMAGSLLWLLPRPLRDLGYRTVSRVRYRLFGQKESCRLPTPAERERFLD